MASTFDRLLERPARTDKVTLAYDPDDAAKLDEARQKIAAAKLAMDAAEDDGTAAANWQEARDGYEELKASMVLVTFHLRGIGPKRVELMLADHKPTSKQTDEARRSNGGKPVNLQWNDDTFPPVLIAATTTRVEFSDKPDEAMDGLTEAEAAELFSTGSKWSVGDRSRVFLTALALDQASSYVEDLGKD